ncbi:MAG: hypothetical protein ACPLUI_12325, partial [Desulfofundulus sp.]
MPFQPEVSMMDEKIYWMGWQYLLPGSAKRIWNLVERFGSPGAAWAASGEALVARGGFEPRAAADLVRRRSELDLRLSQRRWNLGTLKPKVS